MGSSFIWSQTFMLHYHPSCHGQNGSFEVREAPGSEATRGRADKTTQESLLPSLVVQRLLSSRTDAVGTPRPPCLLTSECGTHFSCQLQPAFAAGPLCLAEPVLPTWYPATFFPWGMVTLRLYVWCWLPVLARGLSPGHPPQELPENKLCLASTGP